MIRTAAVTNRELTVMAPGVHRDSQLPLQSLASGPLDPTGDPESW